jgi:ABC-type glycerol-3-phosphate transport system permease component
MTATRMESGYRRPRNWRRGPADVATYAGLLLGCAAAIAPILWGLLSSFKLQANMSIYPPQWFPNPATLEHYAVLFSSTGIARFFLNSIILSTGTIVLSLVAAAPAAYCAARYQFRGKDVILLAILATGMIPGIAILIPIYLMAIKLRLLNSYLCMILVYSAWMIPQSVWFIKNFVEVIPRDLEEAALIDGCTTVGAFRRILLPLIQPGLAAISILTFIFVWNDFLIGVTLTTNEDMRTVQVGLVRFIQDTVGISWGQLMGFAVLATVPVLLAFFLLQKRFIEGLTLGGIKG